MAEMTLIVDATRQTAADGREWLVIRLPQQAACADEVLAQWSALLASFLGSTPHLLLGTGPDGRLMVAGCTEGPLPALRLAEIEFFRSTLTLRDPEPGVASGGELRPEE